MVLQPNTQDLTGYAPAQGGFGGRGTILADWAARIFPPVAGSAQWTAGIKYGSKLFPSRAQTDTGDVLTATGTLSSLSAGAGDAGAKDIAAGDYAWLKGTVTADATTGALSIAAGALAVEWTSGAAWDGGAFEHDGGIVDTGGGTIYTQKYFRIRLGQVRASPTSTALSWEPWVRGPLVLQGMWIVAHDSSGGSPQQIVGLVPGPFGG